MPFIVPLFAADFGFVIQILVVLAFLFGGWLIRQLGQMGQQQMEAQRRQQQQRRRQEQQQRETGEDQMEGEINDFLRRAAGQRGESQPAKVEVVQPPPYDPMPSELHPVAEFDYVEAEEVDTAGEAREFSHETEAYRQQHIHDSFDDQLGVQSTLDVHAAHDAKTTAEEGAAQARHVETGFSPADIVAAFRDPTNVRKAIVMSEILTPRGDRLP